MNAFATEVNLIAVYSGLLDVLAGDADAMAPKQNLTGAIPPSPDGPKS